MEIFQFHEGPIELTLTHMSAADILVRCSCVCKRWHDIIGNSMDLWQSLLCRDYNRVVFDKKSPAAWKREYENLYKQLLFRENAIDNCMRMNPLFDIEMLEAAITSNIGNLNKPHIHLWTLLFAHKYIQSNPISPIINLDFQALCYLSHVLSRFCAEFLYDTGMITIQQKNYDQITPECIRKTIQQYQFFSSFSSMTIGSPIRIHSQNIYNIMNSLQWEHPNKLKDTPLRLTISRQALVIVISLAGDMSAHLAHSAIALARKRNKIVVDRVIMGEIAARLVPASLLARCSSEY